MATQAQILANRSNAQKHCPTEPSDKRQDADGDFTFGRALGRDARATKTLHDLSCKTKPISPARDDTQVPREEALTADSPCHESDETKPISGAVLPWRCAAAPGTPAARCDCPAEGAL